MADRPPIVQRAIEAKGLTPLANHLKIKAPSVSQWTRIPAEKVLGVSEFTGIPPHELRPDLYPPEAA
jgi:DNA-binding transcriptional regulator YdaS (Cro superfamily)